VTTFNGFPAEALDFYDDLEMDNSKTFWAAHKDTYETAVKAPMLALTAALEDEFGPAKVFRPYRDVRFAKDKSPYKTNQGAYVPTGPATGWRGSARRSPTTAPGRSWTRSSPGSSRRAGSSAARRSRPAPRGTTRSTGGSPCCGTSR